MSRNNMLSQNRITSYRNFTRITKKIIRSIKNKKLNTDRQQKLLKEIKGFSKIVSFNWLSEKIEGEYHFDSPS